MLAFYLLLSPISALLFAGLIAWAQTTFYVEAKDHD
jgi:hypothetical protein